MHIEKFKFSEALESISRASLSFMRPMGWWSNRIRLSVCLPSVVEPGKQSRGGHPYRPFCFHVYKLIRHLGEPWPIDQVGRIGTLPV